MTISSGMIRRGRGHRAAIALRALAGSAGAYLVAATFAAALARILPFPRADAMMIATLAALLVIPGIAVWAFLARRPAMACAGVIGMSVAFAAIAWLAAPSG